MLLARDMPMCRRQIDCARSPPHRQQPSGPATCPGHGHPAPRHDGRFPNGSAVLVHYPVDARHSASGREASLWSAGTVEQQCGLEAGR